MKVTVLGSGTSTGVPMPACECLVCKSENSKDKRLRPSIYIELQNKDRVLPDSALSSEEVISRVLVDTTPDLRYQALRAGIKHIDAVLYTHAHADHIFGMDDLRSFNFVHKYKINCYAEEKTLKEIKIKFRYVFEPDEDYQGGGLPQLELLPIFVNTPLELFGVQILPLRLLHGHLEVLGFRIGAFAYLTDCSFIPEETYSNLKGLKYLILDGLRHRPHKTHFTIEQAIVQAKLINADKTYLTHIAHEVLHDEENARIKETGNSTVELAYDGLVLNT